MASKAYDRAMKQIESPSETQLAEMIMRDIAQLSENAQVQGVTAYVRRPVQRERPNERFLQGTLRSVKFANRKAEEEQMWARRGRLHQQPEAAPMRSHTDRDVDAHRQRSPTSTDLSRNDSSGSAPACVREDAISREDDDIAETLARKRPRGRGAVGPRSDEPGPFLPVSAAEDDDGWRAQHVAPTFLGPERPSWLPQPTEPASGRVRDVSLEVTARAAKQNAQDTESGEADSVSRKGKKAKKKKKKKKHKDK